VLLITDRADQIQSLERMLALWGRFDVVDLHRPAARWPGPPSLLITDIDLASPVSIDAVRKALAGYGAGRTPHLCLVRDGSVRSALQANAIGATGILPVDASARILLGEVSRMLHPDEGSDDPMRRSFVSASAGMSDMLEAAALGRALPVAAVAESVAAINEAAEDLDLGGWLDLVWNHDDLTYQHCLLVAGLAAVFGRHLGFSGRDRTLLTSAAVLHDIGKARIPVALLNKPSRLDDAEMATLRRHPGIGRELLLAQGGFPDQVVEAAYAHHEYLDGSGYPRGLAGGRIDDVSRLITICDIYAALIENRPYKAPMSPQQAWGVLDAMGGKLDRPLVGAFRRLVLS